MVDEARPNIIESISSNLGAFFRHLFPGVVVVGATFIAYPSWFAAFDPRSWQHIVILAIIALTAGNVLYVFTRYGVHQLVDYGLYRCDIPGPRPKPNSNYYRDLGDYVAEAVSNPKIPKRARKHVTFRASSVFLLYIIAEMGFVFPFLPGSRFGQYPIRTVGCGALVFCIAVVQNVITRSIDFYVVESHRRTESK